MCTANQSVSWRYENKDNHEIGVKLTRQEDIIIVIQEDADNEGQSLSFKFEKDDQFTLDSFEIILNNLLSYLRSYDEQCGTKTNVSTKSISSTVFDSEGNSLTVLSSRIKGIVFLIDRHSRKIEYVFHKEDSDLLNRFKTEFSKLIRDKITSKLPARMQ